MDPVFTLQWTEFIAAERLQQYFQRKHGFSTYIPLSRQEKGVDIALLYRAQGKRVTTTFQVKSSRTYLGSDPKRSNTKRFQFYTWFNKFEPSPDADYFLLVGLYAPHTGTTSRISRTWYQECILIFTFDEMADLMNNCMTVAGGPDRMFGFGFNDLESIIYTRGDAQRSAREYKTFLLCNRANCISEKIKKC